MSVAFATCVAKCSQKYGNRLISLALSRPPTPPGTWTLEPFADLVRLGQPELTDDEVEEVFKAVDTDSDGKLSFDDFWKHFFDIKAAVKSTAKKKKKLIQADIYVRFRPFSEGGGHSKDAEGGNRRIQLADFDTKGVFIKEAKGKVRLDE